MEDNFNLDLESNTELEATGAEETELAEQSREVEGAEETELAEQSESETESSEKEGKSSQDSAFAQMRREKEELQRRLDESNRGRSDLEETLKLFFEGDDVNSLNQNARAYAEALRAAQSEDRDVTVDDVETARAALEAQAELATLKAENERLKEEAQSRELNQVMEQSLQELKKLSDGKIKSFEDVSENFLNYISAGLSTKQAYFASQAEEFDSKVIPPNGTGKIGNTKAESEFYTSEEIDNMSREEIKKNMDKVMRSVAHIGGN